MEAGIAAAGWDLPVAGQTVVDRSGAEQAVRGEPLAHSAR